MTSGACLDRLVAEYDRWRFAIDMNCDGLFTISDVGLWLHWLYFLPGDAVFYGLLTMPQVATFFEISPAFYGGWISGVVSFLAWSPFLLGALLATTEPAKGPFGEALIGGLALGVIVTAVLYPFMPASWAVGIVFGLSLYGHIREDS